MEENMKDLFNRLGGKSTDIKVNVSKEELDSSYVKMVVHQVVGVESHKVIECKAAHIISIMGDVKGVAEKNGAQVVISGALGPTDYKNGVLSLIIAVCQQLGAHDRFELASVLHKYFELDIRSMSHDDIIDIVSGGLS